MDVQYEREQLKLQAKVARNQETQDRLQKALYPTRDEKQAAAADAKNSLDQQLTIKDHQSR
jgi:hypothetical protein